MEPGAFALRLTFRQTLRSLGTTVVTGCLSALTLTLIPAVGSVEQTCDAELVDGRGQVVWRLSGREHVTRVAGVLMWLMKGSEHYYGYSDDERFLGENLTRHVLRSLPTSPP